MRRGTDTVSKRRDTGVAEDRMPRRRSWLRSQRVQFWAQVNLEGKGNIFSSLIRLDMLAVVSDC